MSLFFIGNPKEHRFGFVVVGLSRESQVEVKSLGFQHHGEIDHLQNRVKELFVFLNKCISVESSLHNLG